MENRPSMAGTRTSAPNPACLICSERGHLESMSSSDPAQRIKKRYTTFFKRNGLIGYQIGECSKVARKRELVQLKQ